jgi:phage shock protein A
VRWLSRGDGKELPVDTLPNARPKARRRPEDLEQAVREAAVEHTQLVEQAELVEALRKEAHQMRERIAELESEVERLRD